MKTLKLALFVSTLALSGAAFAGGDTSGSKAPAQTHHCVGKDGTPQPKLTHKQCSSAGGEWKKDAPAAAAPAAKPEPSAPAAKPAPSAPAAKPAAPAAPAAPAPPAPPAPPAK